MSNVTEAMLVGLDEEERTAALACTAKHTKYQPTKEEFHCSKCNALAGDFCVDDSPNFDCPLVHDEDGLVCYGKNGKGCPAAYGTSGKAFVAALVRKKNLKPCTHCKGSGYEPQEKRL